MEHTRELVLGRDEPGSSIGNFSRKDCALPLIKLSVH
jgi:hypothetical protein